jgi:hypothetical protein
MTHPVVLALFESPGQAVSAARTLRDHGVPHERVSIVARSHEEEGQLARASDASPGSELEDSLPASRLGELGAHFLSAIALVMPGIGPIVADGPLASGLAEAAGHVAGGIARTLERFGMDGVEAAEWEHRIAAGSILVAAHVATGEVLGVRETMTGLGSVRQAQIEWTDE